MALICAAIALGCILLVLYSLYWEPTDDKGTDE